MTAGTANVTKRVPLDMVGRSVLGTGWMLLLRWARTLLMSRHSMDLHQMQRTRGGKNTSLPRPTTQPGSSCSNLGFYLPVTDS